ncbi:chorion class CB protein M5H4-like [Leguminivora glycinivorella]|uniref:chorion class CB protein M5H4-like n=1 Tax=Leguminivora glycinivorella TaxID=1035111 RepID=UPI00200C3201|nr:chorion class CB protein M5H4-like [Leguminivora glycinivorella]
MVSKAVVICTFAFIQRPDLLQSSRSSSDCKSIVLSNSGGDLLITALGPITPSGIAVATELGLSGDLDLSGALPYLSAVEFQGQFDTSGSAPVAYGCGDCIAITNEIGNPTGVNANVNSNNKVVSVCGCGRK